MPTSIPDDPDALLTRDATAAALTAAGFPVSAKTLGGEATRGGGPPYGLLPSRERGGVRPPPLLFSGIKRWQDIRPIGRLERFRGGDLAAFAAFYGMDDAEAGSTLLRNLRHVRDVLRRGHVEDALAFLEWHVGE